MKIIATVTNNLTHDRRMIRICGSLARAGYSVTLVGRELPDSKPLTAQAFGQKRLPCFFRKGKLFYLEFNLRLLAFLLFQKFDAVLSVDLDTILPGFYAAKWKGKTCVFDAHEWFTETPEVERRPFVKKTWEAVARLTIPRLRWCYTVGPCLAGVFEKEYGVPFAVVRNVPVSYEPGIQLPESFKLSGSSGRGILLYQGALNEGRGLEAAIAAMRDLPEAELPESFKLSGSSGRGILLYQGALNEGRGLEAAIAAMQNLPEAELWLAGEGDLSATLREMVREKNLGSRVKFLGYVLPEDLGELTQKATIGLNLLENRSRSYYFSLANKFFDYIAAGVPTINMDFPEYAAINRQFEVALLLEELTPEAISAAVKKLLTDNELYQRLQRNCREAAQEFVWEKEEKVLLGFFGKALQAVRLSKL